jgi:hypothetical protein
MYVAQLCLHNCRSQWPHGLRYGSAAARLLGFWVRNPPGHGCLSLVSVAVSLCVDICAGFITRLEEYYRVQCV